MKKVVEKMKKTDGKEEREKFTCWGLEREGGERRRFYFYLLAFMNMKIVELFPLL